MVALHYTFSYAGMKTLEDPFNVEISYAFTLVKTTWSYAQKCVFYDDKIKLHVNEINVFSVSG